MDRFPFTLVVKIALMLLFVLMMAYRFQLNLQLNLGMLPLMAHVVEQDLMICQYNSGSHLEDSWAEKVRLLTTFKPEQLSYYAPLLQWQYEGELKSWLAQPERTLPRSFRDEVSTKSITQFLATMALNCSDDHAAVADRNEWMMVALTLSEGAPNRLTILKSASAFYRSREDWQALIPIYEEQLVLEPEDVQIYNRLGNAYLIQGAYAEAATIFRRSLEIPGTDKVEAQIRLAQSLYRLDDVTGALALLSTIALKSGPDGEVHEKAYQVTYYQGLSWERLEQTPEAILSYEQGLCYKRDHTPTIVRLIYLYAEQERMAEAHYYFNQLPAEFQTGEWFDNIESFMTIDFTAADKQRIERDFAARCKQ